MSYFITNCAQSLSVILALSCVGRWHHQPTTGEPPVGVMRYSCDSINRDIYFFARDCGPKTCDHNSLNVLNVDDLTWRCLYHDNDTAGPMKKSGCAMLSFQTQLLAVGGAGYSLPKKPSPSATYKKLDDIIYTNEHHIYDTEGG